MMFGSNVFRAFLSVACIANGSFAATLDSVDYLDGADNMMGYVSKPDSMDGSLPAVVILPDWDNVNDYEMRRATMIAEELGYIGFAADIYGADMHDVQDQNVKVEQATKYRSDVDLFNSRVQSAIDTVKTIDGVDADKIAIIGYCLGGTGVLSYSFANTDADANGIVGAVSFHGGLMDFDVTGNMTSPILVLSGGNDDAGTAVEDLEGRLKEAEATWQITRYSGVVHGFTNFDSAAYNEWVDMRSWMEMSTFLKERFGEVDYGTIAPVEDEDFTVAGVGIDNAVSRMAGNETMDMVTVHTVAYDDEGFALEGYLAVPPMNDGEKSPAVVILPDWDGVNGPTGYEAERAVMMAKEGGYVAMAADIYGAEYTNVEDMGTRIELSTLYRSDTELYVGRIQAAISQVMAHPAVDADQIFVAGYCFGGTGAIDYAFSSGALKNVKAVVPMHGGLNPLRAIQTDVVEPYVLVLSGGVDDAHGNTTELEAHLDGASATWEISRYSFAGHGFTAWESGAYQEMADSRSWWSMMSLFDTLSGAEMTHSQVSHEGSEEHSSDSHEEGEEHSSDSHEEGEEHSSDSHEEGEDHSSDSHEEGEDHSSDSHEDGEHSDSNSDDKAMNEMSSAPRALAGLSVFGSMVFASVFAVLEF